MFEQMRLRSIRKSQIANLQTYIDSVYESELRWVRTPQERSKATHIAHVACESEKNKLALLQHEEQLEKLKSAPLRFLQIVGQTLLAAREDANGKNSQV